MNKVLLIAAVVVTTMVSCKKDRVCSCKTYTTYNGAGATSFDQDITMKDVSRRTAFNACVHTKTVDTYTTGGVSVVVDQDVNCSLK